MSVFEEDLALAKAAAAGDSAGLAQVGALLKEEVERAARRAGNLPVQPADVEQMARERLLVGSPPRIAEYSGQGPLRMWLRVAVVRLVQNLATRAPKETALADELLEGLPSAGDDPELEHMRSLYRAEFKQAFSDAVAALGVDDRALLHQRFAGERTLEELAAAHEVHVNTVTRWVAKAREKLETGVRERLAERLKVTDGELKSILRLVRSTLDVSLGRLE